MTTTVAPLAKRVSSARRIAIPALVAAAGVALWVGLFLPIVTISKLGGLSESTYSVVTGILDLARHGHVFVALLIFTFSLVFPNFKLAALSWLWFRRGSPEPRLASLEYLRFLGKWSMLDVFAVILLAGLVDFGFLTEATIEIGVYFFGGSVLLSMAIGFLMLRWAREFSSERQEVRGGAATLPLAVASTLCLAAGLELPIMRAEKWIFWDSDFSIVRAAWELASAGQYALSAVVVLFVILLPLAKNAAAAGIVLLRRSRRVRLSAFLREVEAWSMLDVFALGVFVVGVKIGDMVAVEPRVGLWFYLAGLALSVLVSISLRLARLRPVTLAERRRAGGAA
jgi:paraquat-inducible protein A